MDLGTIFFGLALIVIVAFLVARPLIERRGPREKAADPASHLAAERETLLAALRDLDFDHATGKINTEDYTAQRAQLVAQGVNVLKNMDRLRAGGRPAGATAELQTPVDLEAQIEARVAARRRGQSAKPASAGFCPQCGSPFQADDRFCHKCGASLLASR